MLKANDNFPNVDKSFASVTISVTGLGLILIPIASGVAYTLPKNKKTFP